MGFLAFLILLVLSVLLVTTGWRGRRVGESPHCKACAFDLSGLAEEQPRCPECGADITEPAATVLGARRRRPRRLGFGLAGLALCATLGWFGVQGKLSTASVIASLPSGWMIGYAVGEGERPFAEEMLWELGRRMAVGTLTDPAQLQRLGDSLVDGLRDPQTTVSDGYALVVQQTAIQPVVPIGARRALARALLSRAANVEAAWRFQWGDALVALHNDSILSEAEWIELLRIVATPRLWRLGDGPLAPGEEFVFGVRYLDRGLRLWDAMHMEVFNVPEGIEGISDIGSSNWLGRRGLHANSWPDRLRGSSSGLPGNFRRPRAILRTPSEPGRYEIGITVLMVEEGDGDLSGFGRMAGAAYPNTLAFEGTLTIEVREDTAPVPAAEQPIGEWLEGRVLPAQRNGSGSGGIGYEYHGMTIDLALPPGPFRATGELVAVRQNGERETLGAFQVVIDDDGMLSKRWVRGRDGRRGFPGRGNSPDGRHPPSIDVEVESQHLTPSNPDQLLLVFDTLELPDGRTHKGPEPLEVPVPAHPLGWSTSW